MKVSCTGIFNYVFSVRFSLAVTPLSQIREEYMLKQQDEMN